MANEAPLPEQLQQQLQQYLSERGEDEKIDVVVLTELEKPPPDAFEMFRAAGWYKDKSKEQLQERASKRTPKRPHPLSFVELKKFGYESLSAQITAYGGPHVVGLKIGLDWQEPREVWDERIQPRITDSYTLGGVKGELKLGGSFEEQLKAAEEIDLDQLKQAISELKMKQQQGPSSASAAAADGDSGVEYNTDVAARRARRLQELNRRYQEAQEAQRERFSLTGSERLNLALVSLVGAAGWGRALNAVAQNDQRQQQQLLRGLLHVDTALLSTVLQDAKAAAALLLAVNIVSAVAAPLIAGRSGKTQWIWSLKGLFGGAVTIVEAVNLAAPPASNTADDVSKSIDSNSNSNSNSDGNISSSSGSN